MKPLFYLVFVAFRFVHMLISKQKKRHGPLRCFSAPPRAPPQSHHGQHLERHRSVQQRNMPCGTILRFFFFFFFFSTTFFRWILFVFVIHPFYGDVHVRVWKLLHHVYICLHFSLDGLLGYFLRKSHLSLPILVRVDCFSVLLDRRSLSSMKVLESG